MNLPVGLIGNKEWNELKLLNDIKTNGSNSSMALASYANGFLSQDKLLHAQACVAIQENNYTSAIAILTSNCFPTYGSLRNDLIELWYEANLQKTEAEKGSPLSNARNSAFKTRPWLWRRSRNHDQSERKLHPWAINLGYAYGRL